jgi:L-cysteine S-thiosulfotransferase
VLVGVLATGIATAAVAAVTTRDPLISFQVIGDGIPAAIGGIQGDADRGRALVVARQSANCVLCHAVPDPGVRFSGNVGPPLGGIARQLSVPQLRLRVIDNARIHPDTIMPSYYRIDGFDRVADAYRGKPILDAQQVEDVVAYLATLR